MWKSNNKKGYTLLEVLLSLTIISLLINSIMLVLITTMKVHTENKNKQEYVYFMEALSKEIEWNWSYDDITGFNNQYNLYIDKEHMNLGILKYNNPKEIFSDTMPMEQPYIEIAVINGDILTFQVNLYYKTLNKQNTMSMTFYKGRYR